MTCVMKAIVVFICCILIWYMYIVCIMFLKGKLCNCVCKCLCCVVLFCYHIWMFECSMHFSNCKIKFRKPWFLYNQVSFYTCFVVYFNCFFGTCDVCKYSKSMFAANYSSYLYVSGLYHMCVSYFSCCFRWNNF